MTDTYNLSWALTTWSRSIIETASIWIKTSHHLISRPSWSSMLSVRYKFWISTSHILWFTYWIYLEHYLAIGNGRDYFGHIAVDFDCLVDHDTGMMAGVDDKIPLDLVLDENNDDGDWIVVGIHVAYGVELPVDHNQILKKGYLLQGTPIRSHFGPIIWYVEPGHLSLEILTSIIISLVKAIGIISLFATFWGNLVQNIVNHRNTLDNSFGSP